MSLVSDHWPGVEEEVQAQEKWMDEKKRELSPFTSSGLDHFKVIEQEDGFTCRAGFINLGKDEER